MHQRCIRSALVRSSLLGARCATVTSSHSPSSSSAASSSSSARHIHDSPATRPPGSFDGSATKKRHTYKPRAHRQATDPTKFYSFDAETHVASKETSDADLLPRIEAIVGAPVTRAALREAARAGSGQGYLPHPIRHDSEVAMKAILRQEARLAVDDTTQVRPGSLSEGLESEDDDGTAASFTPGTFVETRKNEQSVQAIVLDEVVEDRKWTVFSLNSHGEVFGHSRSDVHFAVPNFISADHAARCGNLFITSTPSQIAARVEALKRLRLMSKETQAGDMGSKTWENQRAVNIYDTVKAPDPTRWSSTTVAQVTHLFYTDPSFVDYYKTHKYLMDNPLHYVATRNYLKTQRLAVRPERDVQEIKDVLRLITKYRDDTAADGQLERFLEKARRVLKEYDARTDRRVRGKVSVEPLNVTWNQEDQLFLNFLLRSCQPSQSNQRDPYTIGRNSIMKLLVPHGPPLQDSVVHSIIEKLGIIAPWQNLYELTPMFNPTGDFTVRNPLAKEDAGIVERSMAYNAVAGAVLGPEDLHPTDPLEAVRHDFGDMKVLVIDAKSAEELDDGISLERIPSEPDAYWLHVHIADPASVLHPGHVLCRKARERSSTYYFGSQSFPLFPKELMHHPSLAMSLGDRSNGGLGNRTITFSVKLDMQGNLLDYKARAGLVRNIRKATYHDVNRALGVPYRDIIYPFGGPQEPLEYTTPFAEDEVADLRILQRLMDAQVKRRVDSGCLIFTAESARVEWKERPDVQTPCMTGAVFHGYPEMRYSVTSSNMEDYGGHSLVAEAMKLACRAMSRLGTDHNVPLMRRVMEPWIPASEEAGEALRNARSEQGFLNLFESLHHILINPPSTVSLQPKGHSTLGVADGEGYVRATSPLRRFEDLVAHWQMHHILLGPKAPRRPPFDVADMEKFAIEALNQVRNVRRLHAADNMYFALVQIKRYMEDTARGVERPGGDILEGLRAFNTMGLKKNLIDNAHHTFVHIPHLGLLGHLVDLDLDFRQVPLSTELRVKVKGVELGIKRPRLLVTLDGKAS